MVKEFNTDGSTKCKQGKNQFGFGRNQVFQQSLDVFWLHELATVVTKQQIPSLSTTASTTLFVSNSEADRGACEANLPPNQVPTEDPEVPEVMSEMKISRVYILVCGSVGILVVISLILFLQCTKKNPKLLKNFQSITNKT